MKSTLVGSSLVALILHGSLIHTKGILQLSFEVDEHYMGNFTIGPSNKAVNMMALMNLEATVLAGNTCDECLNKFYNYSANPTSIKTSYS